MDDKLLINASLAARGLPNVSVREVFDYPPLRSGLFIQKDPTGTLSIPEFGWAASTFDWAGGSGIFVNVWPNRIELEVPETWVRGTVITARFVARNGNAIEQQKWCVIDRDERGLTVVVTEASPVVIRDERWQKELEEASKGTNWYGVGETDSGLWIAKFNRPAQAAINKVLDGPYPDVYPWTGQRIFWPADSLEASLRTDAVIKVPDPEIPDPVPSDAPAPAPPSATVRGSAADQGFVSPTSITLMGTVSPFDGRLALGFRSAFPRPVLSVLTPAIPGAGGVDVQWATMASSHIWPYVSLDGPTGALAEVVVVWLGTQREKIRASYFIVSWSRKSDVQKNTRITLSLQLRSERRQSLEYDEAYRPYDGETRVIGGGLFVYDAEGGRWGQQGGGPPAPDVSVFLSAAPIAEAPKPEEDDPVADPLRPRRISWD